MRCKQCGKEFQDVEIKSDKPTDRGDGVMYNSVSYNSKPVCPNCGHDNSPRVYL